MSKLIKRRPTVLPSTEPYHTASGACHGISVSAAFNQNNSSEDITSQCLLPLVRSPSPLQLDIPTHQPWHERRTNFELSPKQQGHHSKASVSSSPPTTSFSTEALASLVWIGTPLTVGASVSTTRIPAYSPKRANQEIDVLSSMVADENLPDEIVVERLEIIRKGSAHKDKHVTRSTKHSTPLSLSKRGFSLPEFRLGEYSARNTSLACQSDKFDPVQQSIPASVILDDAQLDSDDAAVWRTARKALFCIREMFRTERNYQEALKALLAGQTTNPPPSLMLSHLPDLIQVSESLLKADPSAWGVSTAFIACEDDIETAMVSWSSVVANFFTDSKEVESSSMWRRRKSLLLSATGYPPPSIARKSRGGSLPASPSVNPPLLSLMNEAGSRTGERQQANKQYWKVFNDGIVDTPTEQRRSRDNLVNEKDSRANDSKRKLPTRRQSVRDLAIQPTQRVMRYVLLFQDLLENTPPTSPSHALVERALQAASHITSECNRAQGNTALLRR